MKSARIISLLVAGWSVAAPGSANAQTFVWRGAPPFSPPFVATLSNSTPLTLIRGRPGDEIYLALRDIGGSGFFNRKDRLYLQFRRGRLAGWKGDWGRNWMWQ